MEHFCFLKDDEEKIYEYVKMYVDFFKTKQDIKKIMQIGNIIQYKEIELHLNRKRITDPQKRNDEANRWIMNEKNGNKFRIYLNTIVIVAFMLHIDNDDCCYENFIKKRELVNQNKTLFEYIFIY